MKKRWRKFNFVEWRSDPDLRRCSREARSLWLDLVGLIYDAEDEGRLSIKGRVPTVRELAEILGDDPRTIRRLMTELQAAGVFDIVNNFVTSRRILRELVLTKIAQESGKRGGNPALQNNGLGETTLKGALILETRDQKIDKSSEPKGSGADAPQEPLSIKAKIWAVGRPMFEAAGCAKGAAGTVIGTLIKTRGEIDALAIVTQMRADPPADPESYLWKIINGKAELEIDTGAAPQLELVLIDGRPVTRPIARRAG